MKTKNKKLSIVIDQGQANLLLRALESLEGEKDNTKTKNSCHKLWNKIFDAGLEAGFGNRVNLTQAQVYDLWDISENKEENL